jgi:hypothetical protein
MALFGFGRRDNRVLDLTERYNKQQAKAVEAKKEASSQEPMGFGIFGGSAPTMNSEPTEGASGDEKKRKLAKRLVDMTSKIEELSNQIYHLQQRIEVLEKKGGVGSY